MIYLCTVYLRQKPNWLLFRSLFSSRKFISWWCTHFSKTFKQTGSHHNWSVVINVIFEPFLKTGVTLPIFQGNQTKF